MFRDYHQTATYWAPSTPNGFGGYTYATPVQIIVRWEYKQEEVVKENGETVVSRAVVFTSLDLANHGYLYLGTSTTADPTTVANAFQIQAIIKTPDLRNMTSERRAIL